MEYIKTQFLISKEIKNHEIFLKDPRFKPQASSPQATSPQATSNKPRAGGAHKVQALKPQAASDKRPNLPLLVGGWAHNSQAL